MERIIPRPEHPNPQWERESFVNLNGEWQFEIDRGASGHERGLIEASTLSSVINVPFCPESSLSGVCDKDFMLQVWYKKTVTFTEEELNGNRVILHFGAADFITTVYVDGKKVGGSHVGGYGSFEYDITPFVKAGENLITVQCYDDTRSPTQPLGKQCNQYFSRGCSYTRTTGIWQTVWYEIVPETHIKCANIIPDVNNASVSVSFELEGKGDISAEVFFEGKKVGEAKKKSVSVTASLEIALSESHLWDVGVGNLYDVVFTFGKDKVKSYFGLRHVELKDGKFLLNGKSVFQRLVLDQGYYHDGILTAPTEAALERDIDLSMAAGFNGARLHQKVFEPRFLYHADKKGYLVWGEYSSWGIDHSDLANICYFEPDWLSVVKRDRNHPAIIGWCPFNETWDYGPSVKRQCNDFLRMVYDATKLLDPTRPCIDTSGNYHVVTDIFDVHDYDQNPETFREHYDLLVKENVLYDKFSSRQTWRGEPVFISEYGGIGINIENNAYGAGQRKTAWSYGKSCFSYEEFYERYKGLTDAMLDNPRIMGFCYTQLTDVEQEMNGIFDFETREPKFDLEIMSSINKRKAAIED